MIDVFRLIDDIAVKVCEVSARQASHISAIMGADEVRISVVVDTALDIQDGDFIVLDGVNYTLNRDAEITVNSDVNLRYELTFEHPSYTLLNKLYTERITGSTNFFLTGKLEDFVSMIVWNINKTEQNELGVDTGWSVGDIIDTDYRNISFVETDCRKVLDQLAEEFEVEYRFNNKQIIFEERVERVTDYLFEQGKGKGLYRVTQQNVDKEDTVTRLYVRGGNQNVLPAYADEEGYFKLPENFLEDFSEHSKVVERKVKFEDEFPKFVGEVATVSGDVNEIITCPEIDFDITDIAVGDTARINFLTGDLMGLSFKFQWNYSQKRVTLLLQEDETSPIDGEGNKPNVPNVLKRAEIGDKFNFTGVIMPQSYIDASISRLRSKGEKRLSFFSKKRVKYSVDIDHRFLRGKPELKVGDLVVLFVAQKGMLDAIRITQLERNLHTNAIYATISNYLEHDWGKYIEGRINDVKNQILNGQTGIQVVDGVIYRDRGVWDANIAANNPYVKNSKINDMVWHDGHKWLCMKNGTTDEPSFMSDDWKQIEGRSDARMEFDSSNGFAFFSGAVDTVITPIVMIGNSNVSSDIVEEQWSWTRTSGDSVADAIWDAQHIGQRVLNLKNEDMSPRWSKSNPIRFTCTAIYPSSAINPITSYIEV